jgi:hypothetical protein
MIFVVWKKMMWHILLLCYLGSGIEEALDKAYPPSDIMVF